MFVQVVQGGVGDADEMRAALERWVDDIAPGADGWVGVTAGVTQDGRFLMLTRFASEDAARRNAERPEHDQWWSQTVKLFATPPTVRDSRSVIADVVGDPDAAGFVQVIQGRTADPARARQLMTKYSDEWAAFRPDIVGSIEVEHDAGDYTTALYFTSEAQAREGERKEPPAALAAQMSEMQSISVGQPVFYDLEQPWLYSAG